MVQRNETPHSHSYVHISIVSGLSALPMASLSYQVWISMNCGARFRISVQRLNQRRSDGKTQFLLYLTSRPKWVENHGDTATSVSSTDIGNECGAEKLTCNVGFPSESIDVACVTFRDGQVVTSVRSFVIAVIRPRHPIKQRVS